MDTQPPAANKLLNEVVDTGLCCLCGGCSGGCPYLVPYQGRIARLDDCTLTEGQCYQYCPRTLTDMDAISDHIFGLPYSEDEIGVVQEAFLARSTDPEIRDKGQDGGTVTALLSLALDEGLIDAAVETRMTDDRTPQGFIARSTEDFLSCAGVSYEPSPVLHTFNSLPKESTERLAIVGLPCHVACVAKMKTYPPSNRVNMDNVKVVIGLFCGWTLANGFHRFLQDRFNLSQDARFDIPHHPAHTFDVYTESGKESVELDDIRRYINDACSYCWDMTAEFADVSVGSGRTAFRGWNTVIVRTRDGQRVTDIAKAKYALETQPLPTESLDNLRRASLNKKKRALASIIARTGDRDNLLYLGLPRNVVDRVLAAGD